MAKLFCSVTLQFFKGQTFPVYTVLFIGYKEITVIFVN